MNNRRSTSWVAAPALFKVGLSVWRAGPWAKSPSDETEPLKRHRFPAAVIRHAVWFYFRFSLSFRDGEELTAACGMDVSYETIRCWTIKFAPLIARRLKKRWWPHPSASGRWPRSPPDRAWWEPAGVDDPNAPSVRPWLRRPRLLR